ncbi:MULTISPECIES: outer membrane beta-barrel protein [unclassified Carboxylicivirga]|uniref:outer membrane beta-barrel protein n=1 Tax=Carboxylicivirga TaxID=1628153 RepID=UPI003D34F84B
MRNIYLIGLYLFVFNGLFAQTNEGRKTLLSVHAGVGAANFINAEAPHKLISPSYNYVLIPFSVYDEWQYEPRFLKDMRYDFVVGLGIEHYFKPTWSLSLSLNYEGKGIALDNVYEEVHTDAEPMWMMQEHHTMEVSNHYLVLPMAVRKYITADNRFYVQGGAYLAYLLNNRVDIDMEGAVRSNFLTGDDYQYVQDQPIDASYAMVVNEDYFVNEQTQQWDYGLVAGAGFNQALSSRLFLNVDLLLSFGLRSLDAVYNNDYKTTMSPSLNGYKKGIQSGNYYGFNSSAKNFSAVLTVGLGWQL